MPIAAGKHISVISIAAFKQIITRLTLERKADSVMQPHKSIKRVISCRRFDVYEMLQRLLPIPNGAIGKLKSFNLVRPCQMERICLAELHDRNLVCCAGNAKRKRITVAIAQIVKISPAQIILEFQDVDVGIAK